MSLYVSLNSASRELDNTPIYLAVTSLAARIMQIRKNGSLPDLPGLDITFMVPGRFEQPPFEGMRMGYFSHQDKLLHFEVAVPRHIIDSTQADHYVSMVLLDVIDNAGYFFRDTFAEHGVSFDTGPWHRALISLITTANSEEMVKTGTYHV